MRPLWAIVGATGTGKTRLGIELAERVGGEIVGCDSAQIFRGLDVGTAKPTPEERARAPHHVVDVADVTEQWSSVTYKAAAEAAIADIEARGRVPILVGGAGLWLRALTRGLFEAPEIDPEVRAEVRRRLADEGAPAVHAALAALDPRAAARLHPNDTQRIGRALEVVLSTGTPISALQDAHGFQTIARPWVGVAIDWPREDHRALLERRVRAMWRDGIVDEARAALDAGAPRDAPGLGTIGYREAVAQLLDAVPEDAALARAIIATSQYAKRQRNWFRHDAEVEWLPPSTTALDVERSLARRAG